MPGLDGFETCRRLKAGPAAHVPVIFMTALERYGACRQRRVSRAGASITSRSRSSSTSCWRGSGCTSTNARATRRARARRSTRRVQLRSSRWIAIRRACVWSTPQALSLLLLGGCTGGRGGASADGDGFLALLDRRFDRQSAPEPDACCLRLSAAGAALRLVLRGGRSAGGELLSQAGTAPIPRRDDGRAAGASFGPDAARSRGAALAGPGQGQPGHRRAILDLSPRTVNKHLETIFAKLGVENRASAAVLASRALGER